MIEILWLLFSISLGNAEKNGYIENRFLSPESVLFNGSIYSIEYSTTTGLFNVLYNNMPVISNAYSIVYNGNTVLNSSSTAYTTRTVTQANFNDNWGAGVRYTVTSVGSTNLPVMQQNFFIYTGQNFFFTEVFINGTQLSTNYMAPLVSGTANIYSNGDVRALFVPFDNDAFVRYNSQTQTSQAVTSAEVGAIFDNIARKGLIVGSVEHNQWKTGVRSAGTGGVLSEITVWGGYSDYGVTRDQIPHGKISGNSLKSPKIFIGYYNDWRVGLEEYGRANFYTTPKYVFDWNQPVPFGWNSWGQLKTHINLQNAEAVVDFFKNKLPGFRDGNTVYIDLDSYWDNLTPNGWTGNFSQLAEFVNHCTTNGLQPGIYWAPFADWGKYNRSIENSTQYTYQETWLTQNNSYHDFDGARSMDPTHPGSLRRIAFLIDRFKTTGFRMIKIDFLGHAAIEADKFYDPTVTTGMQAFRKGMEYLADQMAGQFLVYAAISPNLATALYVHTRRIACDAESSIGASQYTLNSVNYGWWQTYFYNYLDGDTLVFRDETEGTNRVRFASGIITGTLITGDDFSNPDPSLVDRSTRIMQNEAILNISRLGNGKSFRPVEGNTGTDTAELFAKPLLGFLYLAVFNFNSTTKPYNVPLNRIGLTNTGQYTATELYSNASVVFNQVLNISLPGSDAAIYKFNVCPDGWTLSSTNNKTCYSIVSVTDSWQNAQNKCLSQGASLTSIDSAFENAQINGLVQNNPSCNQTYIGLYNPGNSSWVWINGDSNTYRSWASGYPSSNNSNNVAVINQKSGQWTNEDGSISRCYICESILQL